MSEIKVGLDINQVLSTAISNDAKLAEMRRRLGQATSGRERAQMQFDLEVLRLVTEVQKTMVELSYSGASLQTFEKIASSALQTQTMSFERSWLAAEKLEHEIRLTELMMAESFAAMSWAKLRPRGAAKPMEEPVAPLPQTFEEIMNETAGQGSYLSNQTFTYSARPPAFGSTGGVFPELYQGAIYKSELIDEGILALIQRQERAMKLLHRVFVTNYEIRHQSNLLKALLGPNMFRRNKTITELVTNIAYYR